MKKRREPVSEGAESAWTLSRGLQDLLTCPACGGFFSDPVTEHSGDTFCRDCLPQKSQPAYLHTNWKMQNLEGALDTDQSRSCRKPSLAHCPQLTSLSRAPQAGLNPPTERPASVPHLFLGRLALLFPDASPVLPFVLVEQKSPQLVLGGGLLSTV
uniref:Uncharacterized protein LOC110220100 isoform X2 n=1 Tax=Phascolarctos cinereus TaxID=38626 RepID=A0A6P5LTN4_PHACI|nr:uncharacterized protein LOC110220100 isoform X2 [Phascolarctos cinereus]XP_020859646.1 uncharacterized protein LOC110220102 isoform X2 [Phascolarctos cinereus]